MLNGSRSMSRLKKDLGLLQGVGLLATSLLGTGIFVVPATAAALAGRSSLWAWVLLILLVLPIAFTFARLGRRHPQIEKVRAPAPFSIRGFCR